MRIPHVLAVMMIMAPSAAAQVDSTPCYRFNGPFFWRIAWTSERQAWERDTTSIVQLTRLPHPPGSMVQAGDYLARTLLPPADSIRGPGSVTSWRSPEPNRIVLTWFHGYTTYLFDVRVRGDTLVGELANHADRADRIGPQIIRVRAMRVTC